MEKLYWQFKMKAFAAAVIFITFTLSAAFGQDMLEGVVRIKLSEPLASELERKTITTDATGEVVTGVETLDQLNRQFSVRRFTRVFPHAGKNEARHRKYGLHLWYEMNTDRNIPVSAIIQSYQSQNHILKAEPVYKKAIVGSDAGNFGPRVVAEKSEEKFLPSSSNDPLLGSQWHYNNTGQTAGRPGADISLIDAWKVETGNKNVIIAVTDQGIQANHVDLAANMWVNTGETAGNNVDDDNNGYIDDVHGYSFIDRTGDIPPGSHATHVAGTVAAVTNNSVGVAGVAGGSGQGDGVRLMSCAVFPEEGSGDGFAEAYVYSADNGAVISQNSWGYTFPGVYETVVLEAIDYFIAEAGKDANGIQTGPMNGGLMIFSAGNENDDGHYYPAFYEPVVAVASSTHRDLKALYSNYGDWIDITAPGGETYDTEDEGVISTLPNNQYGAFMGTSMACPHVSGVAGLILSKFSKSGFRPETLRQRLLHSVDDIYSLNPAYVGKLGTGRLNAARALVQNDATPPQPVKDLAVAGKDVGEITLTWTSPQDASGFVVEYDIRYSNSPITATNFNNATKAAGIPVPQPSGSTETFTVKNLVGGKVYYFALKSIDFQGNVSPISNVVHETAVLTPSIAVTPTSITEDLKTAEKSTRILTIRNQGQGPLNFSLRASSDENTFYAAVPANGVVAPGGQRNITITLDASGLFSGTYREDLIIESNDPQNNIVTVPLTLQVTNNGAPIAYVEPTTIDFKSAQIGHAIHRNVTVSNEGSNTLVVSEITSGNASFHGNLSAPVNIAPFSSAQFRITFSPSAAGLQTAVISIHTNDPAHRILKVNVRGEGLHEAPLVVSPDSFNENLEKGTKVTRTMTLRNNGSQDIAFRLEVANTRLAGGQDPARMRSSNGRTASAEDSTAKKIMRMRQEHHAKLAAKYPDKGNIISPLGQPSGYSKDQNKSGRTALNAVAEVRQYESGFEEFTPGLLAEQQGWFSTGPFAISQDNPDHGTQHLRCTSEQPGTGEEFALSPLLYGDEFDLPRFSHASMRINIDEAAGNTWQVVPQDIYYVATRIRFNPDRTIDAMVIDNEYEVHFKRIPVTTPEGYFDLAIEYDNWGTDTSGFPTYLLFINNQHVFSGTGIGFVLGQVAFVSETEIAGPVFDVDEFQLSGGEYIPAFVKPTPAEGVIPGGQSVNVSVELDASIMKYGAYESDLVVHIDEQDSLVVPVALTVSGEKAIRVEPWRIDMQINKGQVGAAEVTLTNSGGAPVQFKIENNVPGLTIFPEAGTLPLRENLTLTARFKGVPGFYVDTVRLYTDVQTEPIIIPVNIVVYDSGAVFFKPQQVQYDVPQGQISTRTFRIRNDGINTVSFIARSTHELIDLDPLTGTIGDKPFDLTLTIDARNISPGPLSCRIVYTINDPNASGGYTTVLINVVPDTASIGSIVQEVWTGIPGREVSTIPVNTPPSRTNVLTDLVAPTNQGDHYGSRIRGYVVIPAAGYYTFWIASNDNSELWLSTDEHPENKVRIAYVNGYTDPWQRDKYPSQRSEPVLLYNYHRYYIEVLHKEGVGTDHVAVGWQVPAGFVQMPIPGENLARYELIPNQSPGITITSPTEGKVFSAPATIDITADAGDEDGNVVKVEFYHGAKKLGVDASAPYTFRWENVQPGNYALTAIALDNHGASDSATVNVVVTAGQSCAEAGHILREQWNKIPGTLITSIPLQTAPSFTETLSAFESRRNIADNYGARIRGFLCVPVSGQYTFWISSNDKSELWLSTNEDPGNKVKIAYVSGYTDYRQWSKYPAQRSSLITLEAGKKYYIEALHKEGVGADHLSVGWQLPDRTMERPMPGIRLLPFRASGNLLPVVTITSPKDGATFTSPATVQISAGAHDTGGEIAKVEFFNGARKLGEDITAPYSFIWRNVAPGNYTLTAIATDNTTASTTSSPVDITVTALCSASGTITREYWTGIPGTLVSTIPVNTTPDGSEALTLFEGPVNAGTNYGARISGYICPPATGDYYFWIASNDHSELWLSTNDQEQSKVRIASVTGATNPRQWTKFPSQKSVAIRLTQGRSYYIEALHKQGIGTDHVSVGWQLPDGTLERPMGGNRLSPSISTAAARFSQRDISDNESAEGMDVRIYPNPVNGGKLMITVEIPGMAESAPRQIEIRQVTGVSVYRQTDLCAGRDCTTEINVSEHLTSGVYILQVRMGGRVVTEKLVVP
ncbi:MAG: S8 family serine peptidase [Chryseosolibacter sp.]